MSKALFFKEARLGELARLNYGKSPQGLNFGEGIIPVVGTGEEVRYANKHLVDHSSVVIARKGTLGKLTFIEGKFWPIDTTFYLSHFKDVLPKYLYYLLNTVDLTRLNESTGVPSLSRDTLKRINLQIPDPEYQIYVVEVLADIDQQVAHTEALITKHERLRAGLLHDLLTYGVDEHGQLRSEQTHAFQDTPIGRIPAEWEAGPLTQIANINPRTTMKRMGNDTACSFIGMDDVSNNGKLLRLNERPYAQVKNGFTRFAAFDVLFAKITPCMENGKGAVLSELTNGIGFGSTEFHVLRPKFNKSRLFVYYWTTNPVLRLAGKNQMVGSAGQQRVPAKFFQDFLIGIPPLNEQEKIGEVLAQADKSVEDLERKATKLKRLKTGLMQDLLKPATSEAVVTKAAELIESLSV